MIFRMVYYYDVKLTHAFIFIVPCVLISLFKVKKIHLNPAEIIHLTLQLWTKIVAKSQAEIISRKLNEELVKLV